MSILWLIPAYFILALVIPVAWSLGGVYLRSRRPRTIVCPETNGSVSIELDATHAIKMHALGYPEGKVKRCTRWPQRNDCEQGCLTQLGDAA